MALFEVEPPVAKSSVGFVTNSRLGNLGSPRTAGLTLARLFPYNLSIRTAESSGRGMSLGCAQSRGCSPAVQVRTRRTAFAAGTPEEFPEQFKELHQPMKRTFVGIALLAVVSDGGSGPNRLGHSGCHAQLLRPRCIHRRWRQRSASSTSSRRSSALTKAPAISKRCRRNLNLSVPSCRT